MMKRSLIGVVVVALALIGIGCDSKVTLEAPTGVATTAINDGGTLHLSWEAVEGAESYEIKADDTTYAATSTSIDISVPATKIEVRAVKGTTKGDSAVVSIKIVETTVECFGDLSPTHDNGFSFGENGGAVGCTLKYPSQSGMDFYAQLGAGDTMRLVAGGTVNVNRMGNQLKAASGSYDDITIADPLGTYSKSSVVILADSTYYLRISADTDTTTTWSTENKFAKAKVVSIDSAKVTLNLGYQKVGGLRWLVK